MRIAYFAGYQGESIIAKRGMRRNRALAATQKIKTIALALYEIGNEVTLFSECYPAERTGKFYPSSQEFLDAENRIKVCYAAGFDMKYIAVLFSTITMLMNVSRSHRQMQFDCAIIYNYGVFQICYGVFARFVLKIPVFLEYEDDAAVARDGTIGFFNRLHRIAGRFFKPYLKGCFAISPELIAQIGLNNSFLLRGLIAPDLFNASTGLVAPKKRIILYAGTLEKNKGVDRLLDAWGTLANREDWELHISGEGSLREKVAEAAKANGSIVYHGFLNRLQFIHILVAAKVCVNPHLYSSTKGNIFPFKIVEYLSAGALVLSTPLTSVDNEMTTGMIFTKSDSVVDLADGLQRIVSSSDFANPLSAQKFVTESYSYSALKKSLYIMFSNAGLVR